MDFLGGGQLSTKIGSIRFYSLNNGHKISIKYSKYYENTEPPFWYGITPSTLEKYREQKITHLSFITGSEGLVEVPFEIFEKYVNEANTTLNPDGTVKHYHVFIKNKPSHMLYTNQTTEVWDVEKYFFPNESA